MGQPDHLHQRSNQSPEQDLFKPMGVQHAPGNGNAVSYGVAVQQVRRTNADSANVSPAALASVNKLLSFLPKK
jgi:hypothetical protein